MNKGWQLKWWNKSRTCSRISSNLSWNFSTQNSNRNLIRLVKWISSEFWTNHRARLEFYHHHHFIWQTPARHWNYQFISEMSIIYLSIHPLLELLGLVCPLQVLPFRLSRALCTFLRLGKPRPSQWNIVINVVKSGCWILSIPLGDTQQFFKYHTVEEHWATQSVVTPSSCLTVHLFR